MLKNHYGITIDTEVPTTGVVGNNGPEFIHDEIHEGIDLAWLEHVGSCEREYHDFCGPEGPGEVLVGSWKQVELPAGEPEPAEAWFRVRNPREGKVTYFLIDKESESAEYAGRCLDTETQIFWSKYTRRAKGCSPCFPGQCSLGEGEGEFLAYDLPRDIWGENYPLEE